MFHYTKKISTARLYIFRDEREILQLQDSLPDPEVDKAKQSPNAATRVSEVVQQPASEHNMDMGPLALAI
jgi:hypothetical protein